MPGAVFNEERCKGCEMCTEVCPKKIIELAEIFNSKGYRPAACTDQAACIGCARCATTCPDLAIEIYK